MSADVDYDTVDTGLEGVHYLDEVSTYMTSRWRVVRDQFGLFHWHWTSKTLGDPEWERMENTWCGVYQFGNNPTYTIDLINCLECACR